METQPNLKISIPKPCHEDWNKFIPIAIGNEKGAFCKVCSKSVHDFTKKTVEEISTILIDEMSAGKKVCGRFNEDQLTADTPVLKGGNSELQLDTYSLNFQRVKKFALALFLVFGGYLFNSIKTSAQKMGKVAYSCRMPLKGEVAYTPPVEKNNAVVLKGDTIVVKPAVIEIPKLLGDVAVEPIEKLQVMGGLRAVREEETVEPLTRIGHAVITEAPEKLKYLEDTLIAVAVPEILVEEEWIMGLVAMPPDTADMVVTPLVLINDIQQEVDEEFAAEESTHVEVETPDLTGYEEIVMPDNALEINVPKLECYPNPSTGPVNIEYNVKENVQTSIVLFDIHGNLVKTLVATQNMYAADYSSKFDISDLPDGIYFCTMQSGDKTATQRIIIGR